MDDETVVLIRHKLDVDAYDRMANAGIFEEDDRIELIDGELIDMAPIGQEHAATVGTLTKVFVLACGEIATVWCQNPVRVDEHNEPQPDFAILRLRADGYRTGNRPGPADVLLLVEVADSSVRFDRQIKLPLYARSGIGEVWIVDLKRRIVDVYRNPTSHGYGEPKTYQPGERLALMLAPEIVVALDGVFG